jgi:hypothetical protein
LPAAAPSVFPGYSSKRINAERFPENSEKDFCAANLGENA